MKIKRHFIAYISRRTYSRTYGGADYTVVVYENKGRGKLEYVGEGNACTRAHRGERNEAFCAVLEKLPRLRKRVLAAGLDEHYVGNDHFEKLGILVTMLGSV